MIKVGSIKNCTDNYFHGLLPTYIPIVVMTKSSKYGQLGPYVLQDEDGSIMENIWQFSKCYEKVPQSTQRYSRWDFNSFVFHYKNIDLNVCFVQ